jgi:ferric-dicitrate binding protein FerR (iron transport regulator)
VGEKGASQRALSPEQARRRRRRSVALAIVLAVLAVLFYVMALVNGPGILNRPL